MKQPHKTLLLWVVLIVAFLAIWNVMDRGSQPPQQMSFSEFMELVEAPADKRHVKAVRIKEREYRFDVVNPADKGKVESRVTVGPADSDAVRQSLLANNIKVEYEKDDSSPFLGHTLTLLLPTLFLLVMFYLFMRQLQAGGGKLPAKLKHPEKFLP